MTPPSGPGHRAVLRRAAGLLAVVLGCGLMVACSGDDPDAARTTSASPASPSPTPTVPAPPAAPARNACYALGFAEAAEPSSNTAPVPCTERHTTATIHVGALDPVVDGHLLAIDSDSVQQQVARRCRARLAAVVGGTAEARRLSRLTVVWFSPTLEESDLGARWFRCDLVALAGDDRLAPLPRVVKGVLGQDGALDRFGTCGTASPAAAGFRRVVCSRAHTWRARATIDLPAGAAYLGKAAGAAADAECRDIEARLAGDILRLRWSFEWPTREEWRAGQRYGYCWTPDPA